MNQNLRRSLRRGLTRTLATVASRKRPTVSAKTIAIFKPDRLGDLILVAGAIEYLQRQYGPERITLLASEVSAPAARLLFPEIRVASVPVTANRLWRRPALLFAEHWQFLSRLSCERLVCLRHQRGVGDELILSRIPAASSFGIENAPYHLLPGEYGVYSHCFDRSLPYPSGDVRPLSADLEAHRRVLELVTGEKIAAETVIPKLRWRNASNRDVIMVTPFGSTPERDFPEETLSVVLKAVSSMTTSSVVLSSAPHQRVKLALLVERLKAERVERISYETPETVSEFFRSVATARVIISVETATAHLAAAFDKPSVLIIGGGHYGIFAPWSRSSKQRWVTHWLPCYDCRWSCRFAEVRCITEMPAEAIIQEFRYLLEAERSS